MKSNRLLLILNWLVISVVFLGGCRYQAVNGSKDRNQFPDLLKLNNSFTFFADLGAWHAYSVPGKDGIPGVFTGPYLLDSNKFCVSESLLRLIHLSGNDTLFPPAPESIKVTYYPGQVDQSYEVSGIEVNQVLEYADNRSALFGFTLINRTESPRSLNPFWEGTLAGNLVFIAHENRVEIPLRSDGKTLIIQPVDPNAGNFEIIREGKEYAYRLNEPVTLKPGVPVHYYFLQTYLIDSADQRQYQPVLPVKPEEIFRSNLDRWNGYITRLMNSNSQWLKEEKYRRVAVKAIMTLIVNWRSAVGDLLHDGITPSVNLYDGFWAWDSWKHAAACALFDPELGKSNIRAMFDYQDEQGMIADCIFIGKSENNLRDTKPPLAAWAVDEIFKSTGDTAFLREMLPKLVKYHEWWHQFRDHDRNGLCEYGSTDGTLEAAAWESGMDNAVRYDSAKMVKNAGNAWSLDQESVDLNSFLYLEKIILARMMENLKDERKDKLTAEAEQLKILINKYMYDPEAGFYFDIKLFDKSRIPLMGSEGWHPLWAGVASQEQASAVAAVMADPKKFNTFLPLPTFQADHPSFSPGNGYWRGPIWLDQVYFGIDGLRKYGFNEQADAMLIKTLNNAQGMLSDGPFYENYHPLTGEAIEIANFSWAAAHMLMMLTPPKY